MWIPKDERKTLLKYYHNLRDTQEYKRFIALSERTYNSTCNLINRSLLHEIKEGGYEHTESLTAFLAKDPIDLQNFLANPETDMECNEITLRLTLEGYDLAFKYDSWWYRTGGMWWAEYKGHWVWILVGFIISFLLGLLTGKLT